MKKALSLLTLTLLIALTCTAQKEAALPDDVLQKIKEKFWAIHNTRMTQIKQEQEKKELDKMLEESVNEALKKLDEWLATNHREEQKMLRDFKTANNGKPGEMNLLPVWEEIPAPVPSLPEAKAVNFAQKYEAYINKVEVMKKQLSDMQKEHLAQQRADKKSVMEDSKTMANSNAFVQQMGGADALMNMSEAERKAAAKKIKNDGISAAAYSGVPDAGMNALMQKMMADPSYRDRFNKMTDAQKQAEIQQYMSNKTVPRNDAAAEQKMAERKVANTAANIQLLLGKNVQNMQQAAVPYSEGTELANKFYGALYTAINNWHKAQYDALEVKVMGEMVEKDGVDALNRCKEYLVYRVQQKEAVTRTILWTSLKERTGMAISEFNDFIGNYGWGDAKIRSLVDGSYTEPQVAQAVYSLYEEMIRLAKDAELLTRQHKGQQEQYELIMK